MSEALVVIDMLNDFVREGAPLEVPETRTILPPLRQRMMTARSAGLPIVYVCDAHRPDDPEFSRMGWPSHAVRGTEGALVIDELAPAEADPIVEKNSYSGFLHTGLEAILQALSVKRLVLTGCVTNICVLYTAYDAVTRDFGVIVPTDCVAALDREDGAFALRQMRDVLGVSLETPD